ncbi:unnamed protein product [Nyctereutes procyonoides]|uniref:(raccoon dog) hypothetical protein n=1 Tax=Nyctereutes procyonoides TaxID=34880 RepID=A0A811ZGY1_NYCPR|nr:unnamed protein product [Nyctereutes procyonoides]
MNPLQEETFYQQFSNKLQVTKPYYRRRTYLYNPHISLRLFASLLYFHWHLKHKGMLRHLQTSRIPMAIMSHLESEDCWEKFLKQYSESIGLWLQRILQPLNSLENDFGNLRL